MWLANSLLLFIAIQSVFSISHYFPSDIVDFPVRIDVYSNKSVERGRLKQMGVGPPYKQFDLSRRKEGKIKLSEMKKMLQCADIEPELDGNRGGLSLLKLAPPTKETLENVCAWLETECSPWSECQRLVKSFKLAKLEDLPEDLAHAYLVRLSKGQMYYDWPYGPASRYEPGSQMLWDNLLLPFTIVLQAVELRDVVFFYGLESPKLSYDIPFPIFSSSSAQGFADFIYPWAEGLRAEWDFYAAAEKINDFSDEKYKKHQTPWEKRIEKAAYFASYSHSRRMVFDLAVKRPDLIHAGYGLPPYTYMKAWNPLSDEPHVQGFDIQGENPKVNRKDKPQPRRNRIGFNQYIYPLSFGGGYNPHAYKYVIVVALGGNDDSTTGRLANILAHSGAVVLLQETSFSYHFSASLKPWVHYVPLTFNCADLIAKIEWLKAHDDLAQKIVQNAANFGKSFLRLEDYYCYVAQAVDIIAGIETGSDVLVPYNQTLLTPPTF